MKRGWIPRWCAATVGGLADSGSVALHRKGIDALTFVAALRQQGLTAPRVVEGAMDEALFKAYVQEFLCPTLASGYIVVWDNLSSHQVAGVREAIDEVGATLKPLPPLQSGF